jgi:hypothetical protein
MCNHVFESKQPAGNNPCPPYRYRPNHTKNMYKCLYFDDELHGIFCGPSRVGVLPATPRRPVGGCLFKTFKNNGIGRFAAASVEMLYIERLTKTSGDQLSVA